MNPKTRNAARKAATALAALVFAAALARPCPAQLNQWGYWENGITESWWLSSDDFTKEDAEGAVARWRGIGEENESAAGREWAGDYFRGDETHGTYARWSPRAGFILANVDKCQARVMGLTTGRVEVTPTVIRFIPEFKKSARRAHGGAHAAGAHAAPAVMQFVPVVWRGDRLLVPENEMSDFGDYLAGLGKYNHWDFLYSWYTEFFVRRGGDQVGAEAEGGGLTPVVPAGYERYLKKPIEATVTAVGRRRVRRDYTYENPDGTGASYALASVTAVAVNVGTTHGVKNGMTFRVAEPAEGDQVKITRAGKSSSEGIVIRSVLDDGTETFYDAKIEDTRRSSRVAAGWKLTTSPF